MDQASSECTEMSVDLSAALQGSERGHIACGVGVVDKGDHEVGERCIIPELQPRRVDPAGKRSVEIAAIGLMRFHPARPGERCGFAVPAADHKTRGRLRQNEAAIPRGVVHRAQGLANLLQHAINTARHLALFRLH